METTETKYIFFTFVNTERIRQGRRLLVILPLFMTVLIALFFIFLGILPKFHQTILIQNIQNESPNYSPTFNPDISFASYYDDNMVLQKAPDRSILWGYAKRPGIEVKIFLDHSLSASVRSYYHWSAKFSMWKAKLPPMKPGGPHTIIVLSSKVALSLNNVLFGDVWICSGQSNMQFTTNMAFNGTKEGIASNHYPEIRVFTVGISSSNVSFDDFVQITEPWSIAAPDKILGPHWSYFSAICWMFGRRLYEMHKHPIGLISSSVGGTIIQAWSSPDVLKKCQKSENRTEYGNPYNMDSVLWNAMIHPLLNMTINGIIWYQGESNHYEPKLYSCLFPAMIKDWRSKFNEGSNSETSQNFPFGFVQLAPYFTMGNNINWPELRWAQTANIGFVPNTLMPNVFMAVAMDLPDKSSPYGSIHPRYKEEIASRLLLGLKSLSYKHQVNPFQGPFPQIFLVSGSKIFIKYGTSLDFRNVKNFEISCPHPSYKNCTFQKWHPAPASLNTSNTVMILTTGICPHHLICGVRYAWSPVPCHLKNCSLYGKENLLPGPPFIRMF